MTERKYFGLCLLLSLLVELSAQFPESTPQVPLFGGDCLRERRNRFPPFQSSWYPSCSFIGLWLPEQCDISGNCWCVSMINGLPLLQNFHRRGQVNCFNTKTSCNSTLNEEFHYCISECDPTCGEPLKSCSLTCSSTLSRYVCNRRNCYNRCTCPSSWLRDHNGVCVKPNNCAASDCNSTLNEELSECAPPCDRTCDDPNRSCVSQQACTRRCSCALGYVRNVDNVCVQEDDCPSRRRDGRTQTLCEALKEINVPRLATECDEDGLFNTTQCGTDECYCVDKYEGNLMKGTRKPKQTFQFNCGFLGDCPTNMTYSSCAPICAPTCDNPAPRCARGCTVDCVCPDGMVRRNATDFSCVLVQDCPKNHCQQERRLKIESELLDDFIPDCDENGMYVNKQCYGLLHHCWCVDKISGKEMRGSRTDRFNHSLVDCNNFVYVPESARPEDLLPPLTPPEIDSPLLSSFGPLPPVIESSSTGLVSSERFTRRNERTSLTSCALARAISIALQRPGEFVPACDRDGLYASRQCDRSYCWCVNKKTGWELEGSKTLHDNSVNEGFIDCDAYSREWLALGLSY